MRLLTIEIRVRGVEQVEQLADYWGIWWPDLPLRLFSEAVVEDARLRLEDDTNAPDGTPWAEWSELYARTRGPDDKLLYDEGDLADSLTFERRGGGTLYVTGSDLDYALVHQEGSRDGTLEARPYVGISRELEVAINDIYASDFDRRWSGFRA